MFSPDSRLARIMGTAFDILLIGIFWFVCSLPIITIVVSTTAAYYAMAKTVRAGNGYVLKEFFRCFKLNFRQSLIPALSYMLISFILGLDIFYLWNNRGKGNDMLFIILSGIAFLFIAVTIYFPPMLSRFDKKNTKLLSMAALSAFRYLPVTIVCLIVIVLAAIGIWLMPWAVVVIPGIFMFLFTYPMEFVMKHFMEKPKEGQEDIWYYTL